MTRSPMPDVIRGSGKPVQCYSKVAVLAMDLPCMSNLDSSERLRMIWVIRTVYGEAGGACDGRHHLWIAGNTHPRAGTAVRVGRQLARVQEAGFGELGGNT